MSALVTRLAREDPGAASFLRPRMPRPGASLPEAMEGYLASLNDPALSGSLALEDLRRHGDDIEIAPRSIRRMAPYVTGSGIGACCQDVDLSTGKALCWAIHPDGTGWASRFGPETPRVALAA
jgi:hypothetical protein